MSDDADRYREQANEAREQAARSISPLDKEAWLRVAEEWLKLASSADARPRNCGRSKKRPQRVPAARWSHLWRTFRYDSGRPSVRPTRLAYPPLFCFDHMGLFISRRPRFVNDALISFRTWSMLTIIRRRCAAWSLPSPSRLWHLSVTESQVTAPASITGAQHASTKPSQTHATESPANSRRPPHGGSERVTTRSAARCGNSQGASR
jgi:hypothetical protein